MPKSTVTTGDIDTAAAAVPAPFGPLTANAASKTAVAALSPNSDRPILFTSAQSVAVQLSYDEVTDAQLREAILRRFHSYGNINFDTELVRLVVMTLAANLASQAYPYTAAQEQQAIDVLRTIRKIVATVPNIDTTYDATPVANFSAPGGDDTSGTITNSSTGTILMYHWDWGDGSTSVGQSPAAHPYTTPGSKTITLTVVGPGGVSQKAVVITVT